MERKAGGEEHLAALTGMRVGGAAVVLEAVVVLEDCSSPIEKHGFGIPGLAGVSNMETKEALLRLRDGPFHE